MKKIYTVLFIMAFSVLYSSGQECQARFNIVNQLGNPLYYAFIPQIPDSFASYFWSFGDGQYSYDMSPLHHYDAVGNYVVSLAYTSADSCMAIYSDTLIVGSISNECNALWESHPLAEIFPIYPITDSIPAINADTYQFNDLSTGGDITQWNWDFGDSTYSTEQNPVHHFNQPGYYPVCLEITSGKCKSSFCIGLYINIPAACNLTGTVKDYTGLDGCGLMIISDDGSVIEPVQITVPGFRLYDGQRVQFSYTPFKDRVGICMMGIMARIDCISEIPADTCTARFAHYPLPWVSSFPPIYQFDPLPDSDIVETIWDLGDGTVTNDYAPRHRYNISGIYNVCLTVLKTRECRATTCHADYYTGYDPRQRLCNNFIKLNTEIILNGMICNGSATATLVNNNGDPQIVQNYLWSTGETGSTINNLCPGMNYSVMIIDSAGCAVTGSFSFGSEITYPDSLIGYWNYEQHDMDFIFTLPVYSDSVNCKWFFGDGEQAEGTSVRHTYDTLQSYTVILKVYDNDNNLIFNQNILVSPGEPLAIGRVENESLHVYPVPATERLFIRISGSLSDIEKVLLYDAGGRLLLNAVPYSSDGQEIELDVSNLGEGMYIGRLYFRTGNNQIFRFTK